MGARSGHDYIERLAATRPSVHIHGEAVSGPIPEHPVFGRLVKSYAALYDMQLEPERRELMTYEAPGSGERVGTSFIVPRSPEDLVRRREMMKAWADFSLGTLGRTGDYLNCCVMALSEAQPWFAAADPAFAANIAAYYERVSSRSSLLTRS